MYRGFFDDRTILCYVCYNNIKSGEGKKMKKIYVFVITFVLLIMLVSCDSTPTAGSIDECKKLDTCNYFNMNAETEGSEMANDLSSLLQNDQDKIIFSYSKDFGGDSLTVTYHTEEELSSESLDLKLALLDTMESVVNNYYQIESIYCVVDFSDIVYIEKSYTVNVNANGITVKFESNYSSEDSEQDVMTCLVSNEDYVKTLLDIETPLFIWWYGSISNGIYLNVNEESISIYLTGNANTDLIKNTISDILSDYNFSFYD